jgi:hypothetical protein
VRHPDRPGLCGVIVLLILLWACLLCNGGLTLVGATDYRYANCDNILLRAYDGPAGYVRWGRLAETPGPEPIPGGWTDYPLPLVGKARLIALAGCRIMVRDTLGVLHLDYDGDAWTLPTVGAAVYLPVASR